MINQIKDKRLNNLNMVKHRHNIIINKNVGTSPKHSVFSEIEYSLVFITTMIDEIEHSIDPSYPSYSEY